MGPPEQRNSKRDIVVIGGSSGALRALEFIGQLPPAFPAALFDGVKTPFMVSFGFAQDRLAHHERNAVQQIRYVIRLP